MTALHPLDVYETALADQDNPEDALGTLVHYMEDLAVERGPLPWEEWFEREDKAELEQLCKRVLQDFYHSDEIAPFWVSLGYWARKSLLEKSVVQMVYKDGAKMPEQTWHALVDNHGKNTVLELVDAVSALAAKDSKPFLDGLLIKSGPVIALPLRLGMMHDKNWRSPTDCMASPWNFGQHWSQRADHKVGVPFVPCTLGRAQGWCILF